MRDENTQLKKLAADLSLDKAMLSDVVKKSGGAVVASVHGRILDKPLHASVESPGKTLPSRDSADSLQQEAVWRYARITG